MEAIGDESGVLAMSVDELVEGWILIVVSSCDSDINIISLDQIMWFCDSVKMEFWSCIELACQEPVDFIGVK